MDSSSCGHALLGHAPAASLLPAVGLSWTGSAISAVLFAEVQCKSFLLPPFLAHWLVSCLGMSTDCYDKIKEILVLIGSLSADLNNG